MQKSNDLFLLMLNLSQINEIEEIKRIYTEAINNFFTDISIKISKNPLKKAKENIPIKKGKEIFGNVALFSKFHSIKYEDRALIHNSVGLLAIIIQNKTYTKNLSTHASSLEVQVKENNAFIASLINMIPDMIYIHELITGKNIFINKSFERILGYTSKQMKGMGENLMNSIIHPDDVNKIINHYNKLLFAPKNKIFELEYRMKNSKDKWIWLLCKDMAYKKDENNLTLQILGCAIDISLQKENEEYLIRMNEELDKRVKQRTEELEVYIKELESFSYSISHDLKAPLRAIAAGASILYKDYNYKLDDNANSFLNMIINNVTKMNQLIKDLLMFSKTSRQDLVLNIVNIKELVNEIIKDLIKESSKKRIIFKENILDNVYVDKSMIRQVFYNLLSNAIKFTKNIDNVIIEIKSEIIKDQIVFKIKDNGIGYDMKYQDKIFGVFQRLHTDKEYEGTGIGLAIVQKIINKHGGKVWSEGKVNNGAVFYFSLPNRIKFVK